MSYVIIALFAGIFTGVGIFLQKKGFNSNVKIRKAIKNKNWKMGLGVGLLAMLAYFFALKLGPVTIVQPITNISVLITAFLGHAYLHERLNMKEAIGFVIMFIGLMLLVIS